jgi:hypothetical protein
MARYKATLATTLPRKKAFDYVSDFSTTEEWDPGVVHGERFGSGPIAEGTEFRIVAKFLGRESELIYRVVEYDPPKAVTVRGENATVVSLDRITFDRRKGGGTTIGYDADLRLKGPLRIADPLLGLAFKPVGDRALEGLKKKLGP